MNVQLMKLDSVTVTVVDFGTLVFIAKSLSGPKERCIKEFLYTGQPLTKTQLKQLPKSTREKLVCAYADPGAMGDSQAFLEGLFRLEDGRNSQNPRT
ncbi:hypothetical protein [Terriglobus tenax]|uniref:hypothetical protein n=1 Tax=Terriglobus tenax TaxID=1111115 RepID=UPI0021E08D02|nr:hypothetical protein [Terriglobus tenax]